MRRTIRVRNGRLLVCLVFPFGLFGCVDAGGLNTAERVILVEGGIVCTVNVEHKVVPCFPIRLITNVKNEEIVVGSCLFMRRFTPDLNLRDARVLDVKTTDGACGGS
jgi:hypothetical protein